MSDSPATPLLGPGSKTGKSSPARSTRSTRSNRTLQSSASSESTPLLSRDDDSGDAYGTEQAAAPRDDASIAASSLRSIQAGSIHKSGKGYRWPSILAFTFLSTLMMIILAAGFFAPAIVEEYAAQAIDFKPTNLSIESFTAKGVRARIQGTFVLDASKVQKPSVRNIGRAGTWIARAVESKPSKVHVYLPEAGDVLLGTATVPSLIVNIRNGYQNLIDFTTDLEPGDVTGIRRIANDWLEGRLGQLRVIGNANVALKSGIFPLGTQSISESLVFEGHDLPSIPEHNVTRLNFHEVSFPNNQTGMEADASVTVAYEFPLRLTIPPLGFEILVQNCGQDEPYLLLGEATTAAFEVIPGKDVSADVTGLVHDLPDQLTQACPGSKSSPLDMLLGGYIHGKDTTVYVRGSDSPAPDTPDWIADLTSSVTVPFPFPGHTFDNLIKNFTLADVHFSLPGLSGSDQPMLSAIVKALIALPKEMNLPLNVSRVRADAEIFYHGDKLGFLDLHKWQTANSTRFEAHGASMATLLVESAVVDAPITITDEDVFQSVVQAMLFSGKPVILGITAVVDVDVDTSLGQFIIKEIPAKGAVSVKPISGFGSVAPQINSLRILDTSKSSLALEASLNFTNPTKYYGTVGFVSINILNNNTVLGNATAMDVAVSPGNNANIIIHALYDPLSSSGKEGQAIGRELLSRYISGFNTSLTLKTHPGTIPSQPALGKALSAFEIELPTPHLKPPGDNGDDDGESHFIKDTTMHLFSSTATFTLVSPLQQSTFFITRINATALYHGEQVGTIFYDLPFAIPPGISETPRLPVDWSLGSVGYEAIRNALGGSLKLNATADVSIRLGKFQEEVSFVGKGIGAKVRA
ncbi:MAG: hypothetical protein M1825_006508 [Sarcosagium campestre]|nr:MAG: hypothetical protein M1825_006508 [Sarcosagium campestre]